MVIKNAEFTLNGDSAATNSNVVGGWIYVIGGTLKITNVEFISNYAGTGGAVADGAILTEGKASLEFPNVTFKGNKPDAFSCNYYRASLSATTTSATMPYTKAC